MIVLQIATVILLVLCSQSSADEQNTGPTWIWNCNNDDQCIRSSESAVENNAAFFRSYELCRLLCDKSASLWPKPSNITTLGRNTVAINYNNIDFKYSTPDEKSEMYLTEMANLFFDDVQAQCGISCEEVDGFVDIRFHVTQNDINLTPVIKEDYHLRISTAIEQDVSHVSVNITASTIFGARHALATLLQMIVTAPSADDAISASNAIPENERKMIQYLLSDADLYDSPSYAHRGVLLDSTRNYLNVSTIRRQIKAMAINKLNVLHWHLTDTQSFPFVSQRIPEMSVYGAYSRDHVYTVTDLNDIVNYGRLHGVRILMEIDGPAHAGNGWQWGRQKGLGDLALCVNDPQWRKYCIQPPCGQLNPINGHVYHLLAKLYGELNVQNIGDDMFHMGGDEVFFPCWNSSQEIVDFLQSQGRGNTVDDFLFLWGEFQKLASEGYQREMNHKRTQFVMWSSALTEPGVIQKYLPNNQYIIQTWVSSQDPMPQALLNMNYKLIMSTKDAWYLDHGFWGSTKYYSWRTVYDNQLPDHPNVLGGEVCMWGEYVDDRGIDAKIWPRAAAAAERLWTNTKTKRLISDESRFYRQRERLVANGIKADAVVPKYCTQNDGQCQ